MVTTVFNVVLAFLFSLLGTIIFWSHLMSTLLCLEGMMLSLFIMTSITSLNMHSMITFSTLIVILVFAACEAAVGLALLVKISSTYGTDCVQNLNLLQC